MSISVKQVTLKASHSHNGRAYSAGDVLDLPEAKADWLIELNRADPVLVSKKTNIDDEVSATYKKDWKEIFDGGLDES